jgi:L-amino acid N-acyltransferase YncA
MLIRVARQNDLPVMTEIYNLAIETKHSTGDMQPLRVEDRVTWFREHLPDQFPIFVSEVDGQVAGWCSLSAYRAAFRHTAEISYCIAFTHHRRGIGTALIEHALDACPALGIRHLFAIVLEGNQASLRLLDKMGFARWGYLPQVADFEGREVGHLYYGRHV